MKQLFLMVLLFSNAVLAETYINVCDRGPVAAEIAFYAGENNSCQKVSVRQMAYIRSLKVSHASHLPDHSFRGLPGLRTVVIVGNNLPKLPENLFDGLTSLETLRLEYNGLKELNSRHVRDLKNLKSLSIADNAIIADGTLSSLPALKTLMIRKARSTSGELLKGLLSLELLIVTENYSSDLDQIDGTNMPKLKYLRLYMNNLTSVPKGISSIHSLELLDLSQNKLSKISRRSLEGLEKLKELDLSRNDLVSIEDGAFDDLESLDALRLSYNLFVEIDPSLLRNLTSLWQLDLSGNRLEQISEGTFSNLTDLHSLDLGHNNFSVLPEEVKKLGKLKYLQVDYNNLSSIPDGYFKSLSNLDHLNISGTKITSLSFSKVGLSKDVEVHCNFNTVLVD